MKSSAQVTTYFSNAFMQLQKITLNLFLASSAS